jgi:hypothetical protein
VGTHVLNITHELNSSKNVGTHVLNFTHEHLSVSCSVPRFAEGDPVVWLDKCLEYFSVYQVPASMWVSIASMNLENIAAQWWHYHKLKYGLGGWHDFAEAVVSKFGAEAYPRALRRLFSLRQLGTLDNYVHEFEQDRYGVAVHNAQYDETFFVTHFVRGLKFELQDVVLVQVPTTVDRAILLAQIQQKVLDRGRGKGQHQLPYLKQQHALQKGDEKGQQGADLTRERQLRDFRRLNGLCYACGERFEPGHIAKCAKRGSAQLNAVVDEGVSEILTDEILHQLEQEDQSGELCCHLSFQAVSGTDNDYSMRVRSIVGKQTMLMLVDSGSSINFISQHMVQKLGLAVTSCPSVSVKVANGESMISQAMVKNLEWWAQEHFYHTDMRILPLGAFDAILGYQWLRQHSPMECD